MYLIVLFETGDRCLFQFYVGFQGSRIGGDVAVDPHMLDVYRSQVEDVDIQGKT